MSSRQVVSLKARSMLLLAAAAAVALAPAAINLSAPSAAQAQATQPAAAAGGLGLEARMKGMNRGFKALKRAAAEGKLTKESAALVVEMEAHAIAAKELLPPNAQKLKGDEQAAFVVGYKKKMIEVINQLFQLEVALLEGRTADATALIKAIDTTEKQGHDAYNKED